MNKELALELLFQGERISHKYLGGEYITMVVVNNFEEFNLYNGNKFIKSVNDWELVWENHYELWEETKSAVINMTDVESQVILSKGRKIYHPLLTERNKGSYVFMTAFDELVWMCIYKDDKTTEYPLKKGLPYSEGWTESNNS